MFCVLEICPEYEKGFSIRPGPVTVNLGEGRTAVAVRRRNHTCAIRDDGALMCWGYNGTISSRIPECPGVCSWGLGFRPPAMWPAVHC